MGTTAILILIRTKLEQIHIFMCCLALNYVHSKNYEVKLTSKQAKGFISGPSARRTKDLLRLNSDQLRWVVGLLTGHCHLKGHLFKLGLTDDPTCERCLQEDESATHILCDCEAIAHLDFVTCVMYDPQSLNVLLRMILLINF
jgi:hypothetical protein